MPRFMLTCVAAALAAWGAAATRAPGAAASPARAAGNIVRRPMTLEDLWSFERVGGAAVSPDGRSVAFTVTTYSMQENKGNSDVWLVPVAGDAPPRRLTWNQDADSGPQWSPDGKSIAYVSKRGEDPAQLFVLPLDGGEPRAITEIPVAVADFRWFPDGRRIAFMASTWPDLNADFAAVQKRLDERKDDKVGAQASEARVLRYWDHYVTDGQFQHLFVLDVQSREISDLLPGSARFFDFMYPAGTWDVAPDGAEIAFSANVTSPPYQTLQFDVFTVPVAGGEARDLTRDNPADDTRPRYSPDGRWIVYGRQRRPEVDPDFSKLARYDRKSGAIVGLAEDFDRVPSGWTFSRDAQTLFFQAQDRGHTNLYALPVSGGMPRQVVTGGTTDGVVAGPAGDLVFVRESLAAPAEIWIAKPDGKAAHALTSFNAARLAGLDLGSVRDVTFRGAGGDAVQMFVALPPGFDGKQKRPLLQAIHGGPFGAWGDSWSYRWNAALFAARGDVVACVNFHGSTGSGQRFAESILGAHGDKPFTDIMKATDYLIAQGWVDSTRMACAGGSYGGYLVDWILGHTDRYAALISHAGPYDLMAQFASDATYGRALNYGAAPWENPQLIDQYSPNRYAAHFKTPTLILHGEKDYRVPVSQGIELHGVLTAKGVPTRIVIFPNENHWISRPQSSRLWHQEFRAWLDKYLGPVGVVTAR